MGRCKSNRGSTSKSAHVRSSAMPGVPVSGNIKDIVKTPEKAFVANFLK